MEQEFSAEIKHLFLSHKFLILKKSVVVVVVVMIIIIIIVVVVLLYFCEEYITEISFCHHYIYKWLLTNNTSYTNCRYTYDPSLTHYSHALFKLLISYCHDIKS